MSRFSLDCKNLLDHNLANCNLILFGRLNLQLDHNLHSHKLIKVSIQFNTEKYISHISFFFFFIGKKIYIKKLLEANSNSRTEEQKERKQKQRNINYKERELRKRGRESLDVSPQALPQSNREPEKIASKWSLDISRSSNVRRLRSFQMHHIKHNETKFQM